jgi:hypothetical protein
MKNLVLTSLCALALGALATACTPDSDCLGRSCGDRRTAGGEDAADAAADAAATSAPSCTVFGQPHIGLGGEDVAAKTDGPPGGDRARAKPYSALVTEYSRVLGKENAPSSIGAKGQTFGVPPDRWYLEPIASAVFVSAAFDVAFEGCLELTGDIAGGSGDPKYAAAPTKETAGPACADWIRRFWSRAASPDQIDACVSVATDTTSETYGGAAEGQTTRTTTPQRRWAYACASALTATGFLTF